MKKKIILLAIIINLGQIVFCQVNVDSLWVVWNDHNQPDTVRLEAIHKIAWNGYLFSQPDSAYHFAQLQYDFAKSKRLKIQMAIALNTLGVSFHIRGNYTSAMDLYMRSLTISEEIGDKQRIAPLLNNIGMIYTEQGDYARAIDYYTRSLTIREEIGDKKGMAGSLNNIGTIYKEQGDYARAIDYYTRSLTIKEEIGDKRGMAGSLINIGNIYEEQGDYARAIDYYTRSLTILEEIGDKRRIAIALNNLGVIYEAQGNYTSAIDYYTYSLTIKEEIGDKKGMAKSLNNIGIIFQEQGDYTSAIDHYTSSLTISEEIGYKKGMAYSLNSFGNIYKEQGSYASAIAYSARALTTAQEIGAVIESRDATYVLFESYKAVGKHQSALEMHELYISIRDSILSEKNRREVIRQEYKYEYDKQVVADSIAYVEVQRVQETKLQKSRIRQYALLSGLILLIGFSSFIYNRFRLIRRQKLIIEVQKDEIESQHKELEVTLEKLQESQALLIQSEKKASLGVLTAGIAHEINNPINFVNSGVNSLKRDFQDLTAIVESIDKLPPQTQKLAEELNLDELKEIIPQTIEDIKSGADRTAEIVKGLRVFTQLEETNKSMKNIHNGLDSTLLLLQNRMNNQIRVVKDYDNSIPKIKAFHSQLNQVFMNILINAVDSLLDQSLSEVEMQIIIKTKQENNQLIISISDNGPGIPKEIQDKIFDPFFTTKDVGKGVGLGLSIAHGIIEQHGGTIEVESGKDNGTDFRILLTNLKNN